jgi:Kef-type K+ transport system membrane component KefB
VTFSTLALVVAVSLAGPVAAGIPRLRLPAVVGEIAAGVVVGPTVLGRIDPSEPTLAFLAQVGFALLMLIVGTHLPLRDPALRPVLRQATLAVAATVALALAGGAVLAAAVGPSRPLTFAILLATSSAAVALPTLQDLGARTAGALVAMAWVAIADVVTVLCIPLVLPAGSTWRALSGAVLVTALAVAGGLLARQAWRLVRDLRLGSRRHHWALDLRMSLLALAGLAAVADRFGTSVLVAGFAAGATLALLGEPHRLAQQLLGVGEGFFVPLFFVVLGARIDLTALAAEPRVVVLLVALAAGTLVVHVVAARLVRLPAVVGVVAAAQLGVPAAVVSVGLERGVLTPAQGAGVLGAALVTLLVSAAGARRLAARS